MTHSGGGRSGCVLYLERSAMKKDVFAHPTCSRRARSRLGALTRANKQPRFEFLEDLPLSNVYIRPLEPNLYLDATSEKSVISNCRGRRSRMRRKSETAAQQR